VIRSAGDSGKIAGLAHAENNFPASQ